MSKEVHRIYFCKDGAILDTQIREGEDVTDTLKRCFKKISDLEAKLAESEEKKESYRLQNDEHHLQLLQFYSRLGVEAFGADIHEKALETLMIMKEKLVEFEKVIEKYDCKSVKRLNGRLYRYDQYETKIFNMEEEIKGLKQQLAEKDEKIEKLKSENHALMSDNAYQEADIFELNSFKEYYKNNKISFAVEQLEKVRKDILPDISIGIQRDWISNKIDNQIKQVKEMT